MLCVSHDRTFLRGLANRVLEIGGEDGTGKPVTNGGTYEEYVARSGHEAPEVHAWNADARPDRRYSQPFCRATR